MNIFIKLKSNLDMPTTTVYSKQVVVYILQNGVIYWNHLGQFANTERANDNVIVPMQHFPSRAKGFSKYLDCIIQGTPKAI
jgi:hypothetical protein